MTEIFIPKDALLASAGIFPVYYWFIRDQGRENHGGIREFLVWFENARKENRERQKLDRDSDLNPNFARFDTLNRSTNDLQSHIGRVQILKKLFADWISKNIS